MRSPLGTFIAYAGNTWAALDLFPVGGGAVTTLHSVSGPDDWIESPTWRSDGSAIEWARTKDALLYSTAGKVYTFDMRTGVSTHVVDGSNASWSPDDTQIVYEKNGSLYVYTFLTGTSTRIARYGRFPRWAR